MKNTFLKKKNLKFFILVDFDAKMVNIADLEYSADAGGASAVAWNGASRASSSPNPGRKINGASGDTRLKPTTTGSVMSRPGQADSLALVEPDVCRKQSLMLPFLYVTESSALR